MKKILIPGLVAGVALLILSYAVLHLSVRIAPGLMEQYYNPVFQSGEERALLFYAHPFVLSFALAWFWDRFKGMFSGAALLRGLEMGLVYGIIATLPSMWITFSAIDVTLPMVLSWLVYGIFQAAVAGMVFARMNP
jgi:hypothetical protein